MLILGALEGGLVSTLPSSLGVTKVGPRVAPKLSINHIPLKVLTSLNANFIIFMKASHADLRNLARTKRCFNFLGRIQAVMMLGG
jgi:hypothetical protein